MLKQANQFLGPILLVVFLAVMVVTPLVILVLGILNFRRDCLRQARSILQALAIWACLTFILIMVFIMVTFQFPAYVSQANELMGTVIFIGGSLIYALVGEREKGESPIDKLKFVGHNLRLSVSESKTVTSLSGGLLR